MADLDEQLAGAQEARSQAQVSIDTLEQEQAALQATLATRTEQLNNAEGALAELSSEQATLTERNRALQSELETNRNEQQDLTQRLSGVREQVSRLQRNLRQARGARDTLLAQLNTLDQTNLALEERLAPASAQLERARARAASLTKEVRALQLQGASTGADERELARVQRALDGAQRTVARVTGAQGVYTVQPGDSLSYLASVFYRNGNRWPAIHEVNAHLLDDPDMLFSGMVLVIPDQTRAASAR